MNKIFAFSKYIFYSVGGAEKSMQEILKKKSENNYDITIVGVDNLKSFNGNNYEIPNLFGWNKISINLKYQINKFAYLDYFLNKKLISIYFSKLDSNAELFTYGFHAPAAAIGFLGQSTIYLRSETDLGINANYYSGPKKVLKFFHILLEYPFYLIYVRDLKHCYLKSKLVFNSQWMATECKKRFNVDGVIEYPTIDFDLLKNSFYSNYLTVEKGIVFIGDSEIKGLSIVKRIADLLIDQKFYVFNRHISEKSIDKNITYVPWSIDSSVPFKYAKLLIVPSIWNEAYGRVSVEAQSLNIPVLVSNRGGLPETVGYNEKAIVKEFLDAKKWAQKIRDII